MTYPPDRLTLSGAAILFQMDRHKLYAWRETDPRFPRPDAQGKFSTVQISAFLDLLRIESMPDAEIEAEHRETRTAILALHLPQAIREKLIACPLGGRAERITDCLQTLAGPDGHRHGPENAAFRYPRIQATGAESKTFPTQFRVGDTRPDNPAGKQEE